MIRLIVVDDQALIRAGLIRILSPAEGFDVGAECADGTEAVDTVPTVPADAILMDIRMRGMDGIEATRMIRKDRDAPPILILTTFDDDQVLADALDAGAAGFALKESPAEDLIRAVEIIAAGGSWIDPLVTPRLMASFRRSRRTASGHSAPTLTARENDVLRLMAVGATNPEVAEDLHISEATVKTHVSNIFSKLAVRDRVGAIIYAYDHGLVEPDPPWS